MNLVKWFRKNNKKVMAVVVIVILFAFISGPTLTRMFSGQRTRTIATYGDGQKMTNFDQQDAYHELKLLSELRADMFLRSMDLRGILLSELLFTEKTAPAGLINYVTRMIQSNEYRVSDDQFAQIYNRQLPNYFYWILLTYEAEKAGIALAPEDIAKILTNIIPELFQGQTYQDIMTAFINKSGYSEPDIIAVFGKLMSVFRYSQLFCTTHDMTLSQLQHLARWQQETIDMEYVPFSAYYYMEEAKKQGAPTENELTDHFDKYKYYFPHLLTKENPFGWGYKRPPRIQLDYMVLKLDDIKPLIKKPTNEQVEEYYYRHIGDQYSQEVPEDPNDPNSPRKTITKAYAEVSVDAEQRLMVEKIISRAEMILQEAKMLTEIPQHQYEDANQPAIPVDPPDYKLKAQWLSEKHKIPIYAERTGYLTMSQLRQDRNLGRLYVSVPGQETISLSQVVFYIDPFPMSDLRLLHVQKSRLFENIGPAKNYRADTGTRITGQVMAIVRIVDIKEASVPGMLDEKSDITNTKIITDPNQQITRTFDDLKTQVTNDIYLEKAFGIAVARAEEFLDLVKNDDWSDALKTFNEKYGKKENPTDPNTFSLAQMNAMRRMPEARLELMASQGENNPASLQYYRRARATCNLIDKLFKLAQDNKTPALIQIKGQQDLYCVKNITINKINMQDFNKNKARDLFNADYIQNQSLAAIHLNPDNILKRLKFEIITDADDEQDNDKTKTDNQAAPS